MTNTHIDKEAREAIEVLAKWCDESRYPPLSPGAQYKVHEVFARASTPLPADVESSPKPEGLKWGCRTVQRGDNRWRIESRTGLMFDPGMDAWTTYASKVWPTEAAAIAALNAFTSPPPDWIEPAKPEAGEQRVLPEAVEFVQHLERASAIVKTWPEWKQSLLGSLPTPQPAEPKVRPSDHTEYDRFQPCGCVPDLRYCDRHQPHLGGYAEGDYRTEWRKKPHPPQPSEQAKGAEPSNMAKRLTNKLWLSHLGMDVIRNYALEIDAAFESQHKAEMEAVKKGASR